MKNNSLERSINNKVLIVLLSSIMIIIPFMHYLCVMLSLHIGYISNSIYIVSAITFIYLIYRSVKNVKNIVFSKYEILFGLIILFEVISVIFSSNKYYSLYGNPYRCEGLFMLICYYIFFYAARSFDEVDRYKFKNTVVNIFLGVLFIHCIYALSQQFHFLSNVYDYYFYAVSGVAGNPNFMSTLTVMGFALSFGYGIFEKKNKLKIIYFSLSFVYIFTLALTKTFSGFLSAVCILLICFVFSIKKGYLNKNVIRKFAVPALIILILTFLLINRYSNNSILNDIKYNFQQICRILSDENTDMYFSSGRITLWKNSFSLFLKNPITGVGIDNLMDPYYENFGLLFDQFADKCHNELLQILVTMGIFTFVCYIMLYFFLLKDIITKLKNNDNLQLNFSLLLCFLGYIIQAQINISVIDVAPYFWIMCGLMSNDLFTNKLHNNIVKKQKQ